ncbi:MAG: cupin domain-containing protein [Candidatus Sumerlaeia bacterium]|nr:cupin domain-containing protein [Candidatus Sumerlaeia bacterium]
MKIVPKPWGEERWWAVTDKYVGKILIVKKGHRLSLQYHRIKHETQYLDEGKIKLTIGTSPDNLTEKIVSAGEAYILPPGTWHRLEALEDAKIFEVSTPELEDVVRVSDDYGREENKK